MQKVRIYFTKTGRAKYISHLDLMRTFMRAIKRSGVRIKYTEGFNPHPHMVFGNPLSLGYESVAEICEVKLMDDVALNDVKDAINAQMPEGIEIRDVLPIKKELKQIGYCRYQITIEDKNTFGDNDVRTISQLFSGDKLEIVKKSKSSEKTMDILPLIAEFDCQLDDGKLVITAAVSFNTNISLNPDHVVKAIAEKTDILSDEYYATFLKVATLDYELNDFR